MHNAQVKENDNLLLYKKTILLEQVEIFENEAWNLRVVIEAVNALRVGQVSAKQRGRWHLVSMIGSHGSRPNFHVTIQHQR